jgi:hypothetical protein
MILLSVPNTEIQDNTEVQNNSAASHGQPYGFTEERLIFPCSVREIIEERCDDLNLEEIREGYEKLSQRLGRLKEGL